MYILFDIGGTRMRFAGSADGKSFTDIIKIPTPRFFDVGISLFAKTASELAGGQTIEGIVGGIAGPLNAQKSMLVTSPHLIDWVGKPLKKELQVITGAWVILENDAAIEALGEAVHGVGQKYAIVAYITIGTGVGGARIVNQKIDKNAMGFEPGHQIIAIEEDICSCYETAGHLEEYISGSALEKKYNKKPSEIHNPEVWDRVERYLAVGLNNTIVYWSPDLIVLGGSVTAHISIDTVREHVSNLVKIFPGPVHIVPSLLGDKSGMFGALHLLKKKIA